MMLYLFRFEPEGGGCVGERVESETVDLFSGRGLRRYYLDVHLVFIIL